VRSRGSYRSSPRFRCSASAWRSPSPRPHEDRFTRALPAADFHATCTTPLACRDGTRLRGTCATVRRDRLNVEVAPAAGPSAGARMS
jgi:hypothetical protein